jgi:hypothetical protein
LLPEENRRKGEPWDDDAEISGAVPLVLLAVVLVVLYGGARLAASEIPGPEVVGLD